MLGFLIVDGIAIGLGAWITTIIPLSYLTIISAVIFICFGIITLIKKEEEEEDEIKKKKNAAKPFLSAFLLILLTEWGDKTQIAAALFATKYQPLFVLLGTLAALFFLSLLAVFFGKLLLRYIPKHTIQTIAGLLFIIIGIATLLL